MQSAHPFDGIIQSSFVSSILTCARYKKAILQHNSLQLFKLDVIA